MSPTDHGGKDSIYDFFLAYKTLGHFPAAVIDAGGTFFQLVFRNFHIHTLVKIFYNITR